MAINHIHNASVAANLIGQAIAAVVRGWEALALRAASPSEASFMRGLFVARGYWHALVLKRMPAAMTPIAATCQTTSDRRDQRHQRWMSGVVVDPGTVGVC